jgi:hypothetical protein
MMLRAKLIYVCQVLKYMRRHEPHPHTVRFSVQFGNSRIYARRKTTFWERRPWSQSRGAGREVSSYPRLGLGLVRYRTEAQSLPLYHRVIRLTTSCLPRIAGTRNRFADREPTRGTSSLFYQNEELHAPASFKTRTYQPWSETWD